MKWLVDPVLWVVAIQVGGFIALRWWPRCARRAIFAAAVLLGALAMPAVGRVIRASLLAGSGTDDGIVPAAIFVLGGGYAPGETPNEDVLGLATDRRVFEGVRVWRRFPTAQLVFSGAAYEYENVRDPSRMAQLMAEMARRLGVPASAIVLEPRSRNTREHPIEARKLPGIAPALPIAIVTSDYHVRRARHEFERCFQHVRTFPVDVGYEPLRRAAFLPDIDALSLNTDFLREWVGIFWYRARAFWEPTCRG